MNDQQQTTHNVENDAYDENIVPAETAARREREGENYKHTPKSDEHDPDSIDTTAGYTVDSEGLVNNYGIEPEMYYEVPGDAAESQLDADAAAREQELAEGMDDTGESTNDTETEVADVV